MSLVVHRPKHNKPAEKSIPYFSYLSIASKCRILQSIFLLRVQVHYCLKQRLYLPLGPRPDHGARCHVGSIQQLVVPIK